MQCYFCSRKSFTFLLLETSLNNSETLEFRKEMNKCMCSVFPPSAANVSWMMLKKIWEAICSFPHHLDTLTKENLLTWPYKEETNSSTKCENKHKGEKREEKSGCLQAWVHLSCAHASPCHSTPQLQGRVFVPVFHETVLFSYIQNNPQIVKKILFVK